MNKKLFASTQFNPKEMKFIDEACKLENRSRSNFIYVATMIRANRIFEQLDKEIPDLTDEEDIEENIQEETRESQEEVEEWDCL